MYYICLMDFCGQCHLPISDISNNTSLDINDKNKVDKFYHLPMKLRRCVLFCLKGVCLVPGPFQGMGWWVCLAPGPFQGVGWWVCLAPGPFQGVGWWVCLAPGPFKGSAGMPGHRSLLRGGYTWKVHPLEGTPPGRYTMHSPGMYTPRKVTFTWY